MHATQSAIALMMDAGSTMAEPKHLRVGVHSALANDRAVAGLLIAKGVFTLEEYEAAVVEAAEKEAEEMRDAARKMLGNDNLHFG